jgi:hypothetical protein
MRKINVIFGILVLVVCGVSACGVTESPVQTTSTPDVGPYLATYLNHLNQWSTGFNDVQSVNRQLAEGTATLADDALKVQLSNALADMEESSSAMATLSPPVPGLGYFQTRAVDLDAQTRTFTAMYVHSLTGDDESQESAKAALNNAVAIYTEIVTEFNKLTDIILQQ